MIVYDVNVLIVAPHHAINYSIINSVIDSLPVSDNPPVCPVSLSGALVRNCSELGSGSGYKRGQRAAP